MKKALLVIFCVVAAAQQPKDGNIRIIDESKSYSAPTGVKIHPGQQPKAAYESGGSVKRWTLLPIAEQTQEHLTSMGVYPPQQVFKVKSLVGATTARSEFEWLRVATSDYHCIASLKADGTFILGLGCDKPTAVAWIPPATMEVHFKKGATQSQVRNAALLMLMMMGKAGWVDYSMADALVKVALIVARAELLPGGEGR